jgi:hypothetical protein
VVKNVQFCLILKQALPTVAYFINSAKTDFQENGCQDVRGILLALNIFALSRFGISGAKSPNSAAINLTRVKYACPFFAYPSYVSLS